MPGWTDRFYAYIIHLNNTPQAYPAIHRGDAQTGGLLFWAAVMQYDKSPLSIQDQVSLLQTRGLVFDDPQRVAHSLQQIGYYRLSAYWLPYEQPSLTIGKRNHLFQAGTTFEQVLALYAFDRQLRLLVMEAIERIETAMRSLWAHALAIRHGPHAHMQPNLFKSPWQHASDIAQMATQLHASRETFIKHYRKKYEKPFLPPVWVVVETMSLGALSRWFEATNDNKAKREVAQRLGMPTVEILEQVLHALTPVRNVCAHHGRLWNRRFTLQLPLIKRFRAEMVIEQVTDESGQSQVQTTRQIYNYLVIMALLMRQIDPGNGWGGRLREHLQGASVEQQGLMGCPADWIERSVFAK